MKSTDQNNVEIHKKINDLFLPRFQPLMVSEDAYLTACYREITAIGDSVESGERSETEALALISQVLQKSLGQLSEACHQQFKTCQSIYDADEENAFQSIFQTLDFKSVQNEQIKAAQKWLIDSKNFIERLDFDVSFWAKNLEALEESNEEATQLIASLKSGHSPRANIKRAIEILKSQDEVWNRPSQALKDLVTDKLELMEHLLFEDDFKKVNELLEGLESIATLEDFREIEWYLSIARKEHDKVIAQYEKNMEWSFLYDKFEQDQLPRYDESDLKWEKMTLNLLEKIKHFHISTLPFKREQLTLQIKIEMVGSTPGMLPSDIRSQYVSLEHTFKTNDYTLEEGKRLAALLPKLQVAISHFNHLKEQCRLDLNVLAQFFLNSPRDMRAVDNYQQELDSDKLTIDALEAIKGYIDDCEGRYSSLIRLSVSRPGQGSTLRIKKNLSDSAGNGDKAVASKSGEKKSPKRCSTPTSSHPLQKTRSVHGNGMLQSSSSTGKKPIANRPGGRQSSQHHADNLGSNKHTSHSEPSFTNQLGDLQKRAKEFLQVLFLRYYKKALEKLEALPSFKDVFSSDALKKVWVRGGIWLKPSQFSDEKLKFLSQVIFVEDRDKTSRLIWRMAMAIVAGVSLAGGLLSALLIFNVIPSWTAMVAPSVINALSSWGVPLLLALAMSALIKVVMPKGHPKIWALSSVMMFAGSLGLGLGLYHNASILNAFHEFFGSHAIGITLSVSVFLVLVFSAFVIQQHVFNHQAKKNMMDALSDMSKGHDGVISHAQDLLKADASKPLSEVMQEALENNSEYKEFKALSS